MLDLGASEKYFSEELIDFALSDEEIEESEKIFEDYPKPEHLKSK